MSRCTRASNSAYDSCISPESNATASGVRATHCANNSGTVAAVICAAVPAALHPVSRSRSPGNHTSVPLTGTDGSAATASSTCTKRLYQSLDGRLVEEVDRELQPT